MGWLGGRKLYHRSAIDDSGIKLYGCHVGIEKGVLRMGHVTRRKSACKIGHGR